MATTTMSDFRVDPVSGLKIHRTPTNWFSGMRLQQ